MYAREQWAQYFRAIFDAIPQPTFVVDGDVKIHDFNTAAECYLGPEPSTALRRRGGEALHCINSEAHGCGLAEPCKQCVIRESVRSAVRGESTNRKKHRAKLRVDGGTTEIELLVTAALLPYTDAPRAVLVLENVTEILALHRKKRAA
jgi:PAS domain-containing protein